MSNNFGRTEIDYVDKAMTAMFIFIMLVGTICIPFFVGGLIELNAYYHAHNNPEFTVLTLPSGEEVLGKDISFDNEFVYYTNQYGKQARVIKQAVGVTK